MTRRPDRRRYQVALECLKCTSDDTDNASLTDPLIYYQLLEVADESTFTYEGQSININVGTLNEKEILGYGHFGNVMLAEVKVNEDTIIKMAVKRLTLLPSTNHPNEYSTHTDLRTIRAVGSGLNTHVPKFFTAFVDNANKQLLICMEACETSMEKFYRAMHKLNETQHLDLLLKRMINHIVDALKFLKSENILHRDVKPSNILINQNPIIFKLCDFGICGQLVNSVVYSRHKGTQFYLAPERMDSSLSPGYGIRSDMWSLGVSAIEIANNKHPFYKMEAPAILHVVKTWIPDLPSDLSTELQQLIFWLLREKQIDRPQTYDAILASSAMQSLPTEITDGEAEMVKNVIQYIPQMPENQI